MYHGVDLSIRKVDLTLIKVLISIIGLFGAFSLLMASFNFTDISSDPIVRVLVESSQVQHLQSSPDLFIRLICHETTMASSHETAYQSIVHLLLCV